MRQIASFFIKYFYKIKAQQQNRWGQSTKVLEKKKILIISERYWLCWSCAKAQSVYFTSCCNNYKTEVENFHIWNFLIYKTTQIQWNCNMERKVSIYRCTKMYLFDHSKYSTIFFSWHHTINYPRTLNITPTQGRKIKDIVSFTLNFYSF